MVKNLSLILFVSVVMLAVLFACQSAPTATTDTAKQVIGKEVKVVGGSYRDISVAELQILLENKDFTLVNVHIPFEGNLSKTDLSIPYDTISQNLDKLPEDKNSKIILYCRSGRMSTIAATELVKLGYSNISNLDGGMAAWEEAGKTIEK